ncbi:MAG: Lrp/AsnC family transcriptional regulator [Acidimicrobiales bacterium]
MLSAFVLVQAKPDRVADLGPELADIAGVAEVYSVTGDDDLLVVVRVRRHEDLAEVVTGHLARLEGVVATRTMIAFRAYSRHDLEAMFDLGAE